MVLIKQYILRFFIDFNPMNNRKEKQERKNRTFGFDKHRLHFDASVGS
jgi:hypothetical protein